MPRAARRKQRVLDARPDTLDFRDRMYEPTLIEVATHVPLEEYQRYKIPILDQGTEGACTGFGLATVANYLLTRRRVVPDPRPVSARMLYEMAKRYDEWPGEHYSGSSARGAMKGWHKHGVCSDKEWPYQQRRGGLLGLTDARTADALRRPLGSYFRVNHKDLVAMHSALAEVGVLYATAMVHDGWENVGKDGDIRESDRVIGAHAFAIVAYDESGLWLQNSWGKDWGSRGFGRLTYDDWLAHGTDVWVARLGAPATLRRLESAATAHSAAAGESIAYSFADLRPHIVSIGNDGELSPGGDYGTSGEELRRIFEVDIPAAIKPWASGKGSRRHLLLYAHGGLVGEATAVQRIADYRAAFLKEHVYPLAFVWHSDYWTTIGNILGDAIRRRRPEGVLDRAKDFMLDRIDDALEPLARVLSGKASWDEMKENARAATERATGGARLALKHLGALLRKHPDLQVHVVGHSAGSIFHAPLVRLLTAKGKIASGYLKGETGFGIEIASCALWAPACTVKLFKEAYLPAIRAGSLRRCALFALTDQAEQDDSCAGLYNKSLLYLVSNAFEETPRIPLFRDGVSILGMAKFIAADRELSALFRDGKADLVLAPNDEPEGRPTASRARQHGAFDDDQATVRATLARILDAEVGVAAATHAPLSFHRSARSLRDRRLAIDRRTGIVRMA